jgi:hypothetical protein
LYSILILVCLASWLEFYFISFPWRHEEDILFH